MVCFEMSDKKKKERDKSKFENSFEVLNEENDNKEDIGIKEIETYDELKDLAIKRNTKTEWDVEFEMESNLHIGEVIDESYPKDFPKERPKLNKEGFIILKKI